MANPKLTKKKKDSLLLPIIPRLDRINENKSKSTMNLYGTMFFLFIG